MPVLLNIKHETASQMIAEDRETDQRIAAAVGVSRRTIEYWKHQPEIQARIAEICEAVSARLQNRIERHERLRARLSYAGRPALAKVQSLEEWLSNN